MDDNLTWDDILKQATPASDATATGIESSGSSVMDPAAGQMVNNISSQLPPDQLAKLVELRNQLPPEAGAQSPTAPPADTTASMSPDELQAAKSASAEGTATMTPEELIAAKAASKKAVPSIWESMLAKLKGAAPVAAEEAGEGGLALSPIGIAAGVATPTTANAGEEQAMAGATNKPITDLQGNVIGHRMMKPGEQIQFSPEEMAAMGKGSPASPASTDTTQSVPPLSLFGAVSAQLRDQQRKGTVGPTAEAAPTTSQGAAKPVAVDTDNLPPPTPAPQAAPAAQPSLIDLLRQAQQQANGTAQSNAIIKAGMMAGNALAQRHATVPLPLNTSAIDELTKQAQTGPANIMQQAALQSAIQNQKLAAQKITQGQSETDPNSQQSKLYTNVAKQFAQNLGLDDSQFSNLSADSTQKLLPLLERYQQHVEANATNLQKQQDRQLIQQQLQQQKETDKQNAATKSTTALLEGARGQPAVAQAEKDIYAASKANSLANLYGDPNKLSPQQAQLLSAEVAKIASGGQSTQAELDALNPHTMNAGMAKIVQKFTNEPSQANAGAFIKQYQDYANALTQDAQKVITDKYGRVIESVKGQIGPDNYNTLKNQYVNRFADAQAAAQATKQHADQVAAFAKANNMPEAQAEAIMRMRMNQASVTPQAQSAPQGQ